MSAKRKGLGRGLDALLGGEALAPVNVAEASAGGELRQLPLDRMQRGKYQPRRDMKEEALKELADSISKQGIVQPIVVRPIDGKRYEIIAGERRWRAAQMAGLETVPAVVREVSDKAAMAMALIENIQRADLNPLEEAEAMQRLINEFSITHQEAAEAVGRSRVMVSNLLRLLELSREVQDLVRQGALEMGHARALLALKGASQTAAARQVVDRGFTVRDTERLVRNKLKEAGETRAPQGKKTDPDVSRLERTLSEKLGAKVVVEGKGKGGKLVIHYSSLDELDGILAHIK
ncbi:MAG TPA: ParB/RepB/Spo0J family partition protein [Gammaproteobacteria bacterium]|nr:ParB/RepB/Spo0J family partition protein [Gammaproteobacteria bacterium]